MIENSYYEKKILPRRANYIILCCLHAAKNNQPYSQVESLCKLVQKSIMLYTDKIGSSLDEVFIDYSKYGVGENCMAAKKVIHCIKDLTVEDTVKMVKKVSFLK